MSQKPYFAYHRDEEIKRERQRPYEHHDHQTDFVLEKFPDGSVKYVTKKEQMRMIKDKEILPV